MWRNIIFSRLEVRSYPSVWSVLLAGTTVFFAYESVRLRGVATDQARRSSYFDDDPISDVPRNSRSRFNDDYDRFEESERPSRRFKPQEDEFEEDYMEGRSRRRNVSRAIPSAAASRSRPSTRGISQFENDEPIRRRRQTSEDINRKQPETNNSVSYTHLTLPTIDRV